MKMLFMHQNMPGQYRHLAPWFARQPNHEVVFITKRKDIDLDNIRKVLYEPARKPHPNTHHYLKIYEDAILHGQQVVRELIKLREEGFYPDVVVSHPGWGESLFVKEVYPYVPVLHYCEFYYNPHGIDTHFDAEDPASIDSMCSLRGRSAHHLLSAELCDRGISPTQWQKSQFPAILQPKIEVCFDGVDVRAAHPDPDAEFTTPDGAATFRVGDETITYVARNLEPYRGFQVFMRLLPELLERRPNARVIVVGGDEVSYGKAPRDGRCWREVLLEQHPLPEGRVFFVGKLPFSQYLKVLRVSALHIYLTRPFVLSWSFMDAMASGCLILASATPPVQEVVRHGENAFLTPFFDHSLFAARAAELLARRDELGHIRAAARQLIVDKYSLDVCLPKHIKLIQEMGLEGRRRKQALAQRQQALAQRRQSLAPTPSAPAPELAPAPSPVSASESQA